MTKLYAASSRAASPQSVSFAPVQEEVFIEQYDRLLKEIRNQLDEFPIGETVLVGNCPSDICDEEIHGFFKGFATAVRLKKISTKSLTTTLYIAKFDSAESASRSKVLHTLSLKAKKILLLQLEDRQMFGKNHVVELNGFQDHPEEVIYDHMSAFGQVNFILKTKNAAYIVYEEPSSVEASSRCEYLDQYPVTIRSVLDTSIPSSTSASASGIETCILEQLDQHDSLLVDEDEGQINNFMQLLDMDNLDEYMEMNEREKSVVDKPLLEVGNEEIIVDCIEEDTANVTDIAAIEKQAFQKVSDPKQKEPIDDRCVLVDDLTALCLKLKGNLLRLSDLPQLLVRVQKTVADQNKKNQYSYINKQNTDFNNSKFRESEHKRSKKSKKDKPKKEHSDTAKRIVSEKTKSIEKTIKKSNKNKTEKGVEPVPEKLNSNRESPPKSSKEQSKKERGKLAHSIDAVVSIEPVQSCHETSKEKLTATARSVLECIKQDAHRRKPVVVLKRLTARQIEELSVVRRGSSTDTSDVNKMVNDQIYDIEMEKHKRTKHSDGIGEANWRKTDDESCFRMLKRIPDPAESVYEKELVPACIPMDVDTPVVVEKSAAATDVTAKPDLSSTLLSDDEEQRLVIDLPQEAKPKGEKSTEGVVQPELYRPHKHQRLVVKLDMRSAKILHDKVHESFLLHLDVLSRVLIKLNKCSIAQYKLPKKAAKVTKPKRTNESSSRKSQAENAVNNRETKPHVEKIRKTDLEKIDNKFLPVDSKLKSQARAKSKHDSSYKKQHHHVPVPELPAELKKSQLNTSFKIPKKKTQWSKSAPHSTTKHNRSELESLHREDEEHERQRKRFHREPKRPEDRERTKKSAAAQSVEQLRLNTPDYFDPMWDDDGGGVGDESPLLETEVRPYEQGNAIDGSLKSKKTIVSGANERDKDKKVPSFRDIWNLPPETSKVWEKEPWATNSVTIDSGDMWGAEEMVPQAMPVFPLFAQESKNKMPDQRSQHFRKFSDDTANTGNTLDSGRSWSLGGAPRSLNSSAERRLPKASHNTAAVTIADGDCWSPEADTNKKITALNLDQRRRPTSRQDELPRRQPPSSKLESPVPRGGIDTISSGDMWDTELAGFGNKSVPIWESDVKSDRSTENFASDFFSDPEIRGASYDGSEKSLAKNCFRGGRCSGIDDLKKWSREQRISPRRGMSPDRRNSPNHRRRSRSRSPECRTSRVWSTFGSGDGGAIECRSRSRSPLQIFERERRHRPRETSRRDMSPVRRSSPNLHRRRSQSQSPKRRSTCAWSPFNGSGVAAKCRSRSRSPLRRMLCRASRSPIQSPHQSPVRRGAARFRSRSRDRYDEEPYRKWSRSPPVRHRQQFSQEMSRERSREKSWERSWVRRNDPFSVDRRAFISSPHELLSGSKEEDRQRPEPMDSEESTERLDDDEIPYSPSNFLNEEEDNSGRVLLETIPLQLPFVVKPSHRTQSVAIQQPLSATKKTPINEEPISQPQIRIKQEQLLIPAESMTMEEEPAVVERPVNVKQESRSLEPVQTTATEPSSAKYINPEQPPQLQEESTPERLSALGHLKQRAERLKKLEEMKLARQKLLAQIKLQNDKEKLQKETEKAPQVEDQRQQTQPEAVVQKMLKVEPPIEQELTSIVTDIKREQQPEQVDPSAASLLLETAVSILSTFGHLLPSITAGPNPPAAVPPPTLPTIPTVPPPLPVEAPKPPPPHEPPPLLPVAFPSAVVASSSIWEPPAFVPMPNLSHPPPFNMQPPMHPVLSPFEKVEQQKFPDFPVEQEDMNGRSEPYISQETNVNTGSNYENLSHSFNYNNAPSWERRPPQNHQNFKDGSGSWKQPSYFNNQQNQQQQESFQLLPPEEFQAQRSGPTPQFDGGFGGNERNRDPRQRFRGNNRGQNNKAFRDPRRNRRGSIYGGGGGGAGFPQQWNRSNNNNINRGGGGGQYGNQHLNRNNSWKQGNLQRGGGFKNFQQRSQQQQQEHQQMGDEFFIDDEGDRSNWDDFMQ